MKEGVDVVLIKLVEDYSHMDDKAFWRAMDRNGFHYLPDVPRGELRNAPENLQDLIDDPYRSLAARLRRNCNCPKYAAPFAEFRWADYLWRHIQIEALKTSPDGALKIAKKLIWEGICSLVSSECRCLGTVESS
ncbi:MAG: ParB/Srx family N-terminal domain-containing protein [Methylocystis silviterrae]